MPAIKIDKDPSKASNKPREDFFYDTSPDSEERYAPDEEKRKKISNLYARFGDMRDNPHRTEAESEWADAYDAYRAKVTELPEDDERTNLNLNPSFAIVETINQETVERNARPFYMPFEKSDESLTDLINDVARSSLEVGMFDREYNIAKRERDILGTAVMMEYYRYESRWVSELEMKKDPETGDMVESYVQKEIVDWDDVYAMWRPLHEFYFDPSALHIDYAKDMFWRQTMHINEFRRQYSGRFGFKDVGKVIIGGDNAEDSAFDPPKDVHGTSDVEILHYYNRATDEYNVLVNGVLVREGPIPYPHKELPVCVFYCYKDPQRFYGKGIPSIVKHEAAEITTSANLRMDYQKRAINKMFFIDSNADIDEYDMLPRQHGLIPVSNPSGKPINQSVLPLEYGDVKVSNYQDSELMYESIRRKTGIDERIQGVRQGGTATEAAILKEASQKRIQAQSLFNEFDGLTRLGKLRWANIVFFYAIPKMKRIREENGKTTTKAEVRAVRIKGKSYFVDQDGNLKTKDTEGYSTLKLTKKMMKYLNTNVDVTVKVAEGQVMSKTIKQAKILEMFDRFTLPAALPYVNLEGALGRMTEINDENPEIWLKSKGEAEDPHELAEREFEVMLAGVKLPPTPDANIDHVQHELVLAQGVRFNEAPAEIQQIVEEHIAGEDAQLRSQMGQAQASVSSGGAVEGTGAGLERPTQNPVDVTPQNINAE